LPPPDALARIGNVVRTFRHACAAIGMQKIEHFYNNSTSSKKPCYSRILR
jgi:hypothetical protein